MRCRKSNIAWTHSTWNPWVGCDKVAPKIRKQTDWQSGEKRNSWGEVRLTRTWSDPTGGKVKSGAPVLEYWRATPLCARGNHSPDAQPVQGIGVGTHGMSISWREDLWKLKIKH